MITIQQTFDDFLIVANSRNLSASYKSIITRTRDYWLAHHPDAPLDTLTPTHIREWLVWLRDERKQSSASVDVHYRNLKAVMFFAEREEYIPHGKAPIRRVDRPVVDERQPDALTAEEVRTLLRRVKTSGDRNAYRDYALHLFFSVTCARLEEVANLITDKLFLGEGYALVYSNKTNAERPVPLSPELCRVLLKYQRHHRHVNNGVTHLFTTETGKPLEREGLRQIILRDIKEYVGRTICKVGPHTWRRTGATMYLDNGVPLQDVSDILGHGDIRTTLRYRKKKAVQVVQGLKAHPMDALT